MASWYWVKSTHGHRSGESTDLGDDVFEIDQFSAPSPNLPYAPRTSKSRHLAEPRIPSQWWLLVSPPAMDVQINSDACSTYCGAAIKGCAKRNGDLMWMAATGHRQRAQRPLPDITRRWCTMITAPKTPATCTWVANRRHTHSRARCSGQTDRRLRRSPARTAYPASLLDC